MSELNQLAEAGQVLNQAAAAAKNANALSLENEVELRQGRLLLQQSRFDDARHVFQHVAEAAARLRDPYQEATATGNIGFALLSESRNDEAIPWFERAIALFLETDAGESVARTHGNLGNCYFRLGNLDMARLEYEKAQEGFAKTGNHESQQLWIGNAANVDYETGDFTTAAAGYRRALEIARAIPSPVWAARWVNNLAETSLELGDWDAAGAYSKEGLEMMKRQKDANWEPTFLATSARIEEGRGHLDRARALYRSALAMRAEDPAVPLDSHAGLARTWLSEGRVKEADAEFRNTISLIERRRAGLLRDDYKLSYLSSLIRFYQQYVDFLVGNHQMEKALEVAESSRSRVLESRVGRSTQADRLPARDYRLLARDLDSTVLEYWLGPQHSWLWVITADGIRLNELPPQAEIHTLIENYRAVVSGARNPLEVAGDTGRRLYDALLKPTGGVGKFLIVPDGDLYSFDLQSLPVPNAPGKFWIEQATVATAPSLKFLTHRAISSHMAQSLLVTGDPTSTSERYPRLQYASQEIDSIAASVADSRRTILRGNEATPSAWLDAKPGQFGLIHFATHASADPRSPLDSAVILAGPADTNRLLARNVMTVPLSARLVTISACRSAGGKAYAGEGLVGFAWAFLRAGAQNVVAGLWDVSDRSTAQLMATLYKHIAAGEDPAAALRAAKLELIHAGGAYAKPFYWAPFQLYTGASSSIR